MISWVFFNLEVDNIKGSFAPFPAKVMVILVLLLIVLMVAMAILNMGKGEGLSFFDTISTLTEGVLSGS